MGQKKEQSKPAGKLKKTAKSGIMIEDVQAMYKDMKMKNILSQYTLPKKPSSDGFYHIWVKDESAKGGRKQLKARTIDDLEEKIYAFEVPQLPTFRFCFEGMLEEKLRYKKDPEKRLSAENNINTLWTQYRRFFGDTDFEELPVEQIDKWVIEDFCYDILTSQDVTKRAFGGLRSILKSTLRFAFNNFWIVDNPYDRINFSKYNDMLKRSGAVSKRVHSEDDMTRMRDFIHDYEKKKPAYMPPYALELQMLMGLRRGEVAALMWEDVHDGYIAINREQITVKKNDDNPKERFVVVSHTKTWVDRRFPVTEEIREFLDRLKKVRDEYYPDALYLFPDYSTEEQTINNNVVGNFYQRMCNKLGIERSREFMKGPHSFRRNGITKVANSVDGSINMAAMLYGNSPEVAMRHYYTGIDIERAVRVLERAKN